VNGLATTADAATDRAEVRAAPREVRPPRTIVQVVLNLGHGGMETVAVNLARGLDPARYRAVVVALDAGGEHEPTLRQSGIEYHVLGGRRFRRPDFHWNLAKLLRQLAADVVHTHQLGQLVHALPATWLARVPRRVHTEHSYQYLEARADHRRLLRWMSARSDAFIVVGRTLQSFYRDQVGVSPRLLRVIPNGVDPSRYQPASDVPAARSALGLPPEGLLIGTAGRFFPEKDYGTLLRGAAPLCRTRPDVRVIMAGDGPERAVLEALATTLGISRQVLFLGWRTDLAALLPALDVFVMSSCSEGLPLVALEALACGVPVVATPVGDLPDIVDERVGLLFPVGGVPVLTQALASLAGAADRRRALGRAGRERVAARYSQRAMVHAYAQAYDAP
jgi:sugar transferase (PEP-CTERM/EpsH1 system associated)